RAIGFAYSFMGIRIQCAQCHKHPFDQWSKSDFDAFKNFFGRVTIFANGSREKETQEEYQKILKDLGMDNSELRGNQLIQALNKMLGQGKVVPFPEIASIKAQPRRNANPNPNNKNASKQEAASAVMARVLGGAEVEVATLDDARQPLMDWLRSPSNPY